MRREAERTPMAPVATLCLVAALAWAAQGAHSEWVYPGPDGKLIYKTTPAGDRIMDFSHAGYRGGGVAIPDVPARITVAPMAGDNTAALQEAIDKVSALTPQGDFRGAVLLDRCSGNGDNIWHVATGSRVAGPIVLLNYTFRGTGHVEGHQRWTTGMLLDNCQVPEGGSDFKNRGSMGSGHGWERAGRSPGIARPRASWSNSRPGRPTG